MMILISSLLLMPVEEPHGTKGELGDNKRQNTVYQRKQAYQIFAPCPLATAWSPGMNASISSTTNCSIPCYHDVWPRVLECPPQIGALPITTLVSFSSALQFVTQSHLFKIYMKSPHSFLLKSPQQICTGLEIKLKFCAIWLYRLMADSASCS